MARTTTDRVIRTCIGLRSSNLVKLTELVNSINKRIESQGAKPISISGFCAYLINSTLESKLFLPVLQQVVKFSPSTIAELDKAFDENSLFGDFSETMEIIDKAEKAANRGKKKV
jgi:hypothetical protein